jgi:hypothetical protein
MGRKSIKVAEIIRWANVRLGVPDAAMPNLASLTPHQAYRQGVASLLETILHHTGNYAGFGYTTGAFVAGETDETVRGYYVANALQADYRAAVERSHTEVR